MQEEPDQTLYKVQELGIVSKFIKSNNLIFELNALSIQNVDGKAIKIRTVTALKNM